MSNKPVDLVLSKLKNVKKIKGGWTAKCPCHDDDKNSLCISEGADGRVLLYCHAGCHFKNIVTTLGFEVSEMFAEDTQLKNKHYTPKTWNRQMVIKTYDYTDEKGNLLYQVCRTVKKEFPVRRPDGKKGWIWGLGDISPVLYRLPSVIEAVTKGETIFVVEGEKDADRLCELGLPATTNPMGAGKWRDSYSHHFKNANVVILPDNDEPGIKHAENVAEKLYGIVSSAKIVHLPGVPEKGDISDWMEQGGTAEKLQQLIDKADCWLPPFSSERTEQDKEPTANNTPYSSQPIETFPSFQVVSWNTMCERIGPIEWAWEGWLPTGLLSILASDPGIGKSALALRIAQTFIQGLPWPDGTDYRGVRGSVLWCEAESAEAINMERAKQWGIPMDKILDPLGCDPLIPVKLDNPHHKNAVKTAALSNDVRLIVVDSLRGIHRGDENSSASIEVVMWLASLARDVSKPILLTHHLRKRSIADGDEVTLDRLRGSSAIVQPARIVWALDIPDPSKKDTKRLSVIKSNIARFPPPLGLSIAKEGIQFGAAPQTPRKETVVDRATDRIKAILSKGPLPVSQVLEALEVEGISRRSIFRSKDVLQLVIIQKGHQKFWALPTDSVEF
ncbi:MAG: AAA family ATPase [Syntrophales bacterium LBB04]|nr:AAA family ATPase [Syntrophales bacterium LBB04]